MKVTYLGHSGFLTETEYAYYLFDYIRGDLPMFSKDKPLYIFASHWHEDHFSHLIFEEGISKYAERYFISSDIIRHECLDNIKDIDSFMRVITVVDENKDYEHSRIHVSTLHSTDEGVAFLVKEEGGQTIYHAGDLNWWHWEGEPDPWNPDMEKAFKQEIGKLQGQTIDVAFVPLDPRLEDAYWYGLGYFEEKVSAKHIFPMHFWNDYRVIQLYISEHHKNNAIIHEITNENSYYEI